MKNIANNKQPSTATRRTYEKKMLLKTSGLSKLYLSNFSWYVGVFLFLSHGPTITGIFSSPWNLKQYLRKERSTWCRNVVNVREKPYVLAEQKTQGVMEMDVIKTSRQEKKNCWDVFSYYEDSRSFPLFLFPPLRLISFLHVQTGSSQSRVKPVTWVFQFILPHLYLPFCSTTLRQTSPSIWHHE